MSKKMFAVVLLLSFNKPAFADLNDQADIYDRYCVEEGLNIKSFNSGEAFYLWTTASVKVA